MSNKDKIKKLIQDYIEEAPPGGENNQVYATHPATAGNGLKEKLMEKSLPPPIVKQPIVKKGKGRPMKKQPRKANNWQKFLKEYIAEQKKMGKEKSFAEMVKDASKQYKSGGVASAPIAFAGPYLQPRSNAEEIKQPPEPARENKQFKPDTNNEENMDVDANKFDGASLDGGIDLKKIKAEAERRLKGVAQAFKGIRMNYPPAARKTLEKYGNMPYTEVKVCRKPLEENLQNAIKLFAKTGKGSYDQFFHLSIRFKLENGMWLRLDKREVLHAIIDDEQEDTKCIMVKPSDKSGKTVNEVLLKTEKKVGADRFYKYKSTSWNCQRWVLDIIEANDMKADKEFILQNVGELFDPTVSAFADFATDVKAKLNLLTEGYGLSKAQKMDFEPNNPNYQEVGIPDMEDSIYLGQPSEKVVKNITNEYKKRATKDLSGAGIANLEKSGFVEGGCDYCSSDDEMMIIVDSGGAKKSKKDKKPRKESNYMKALKMWNAKNEGAWCVPRKDSKEYIEVMKMRDELNNLNKKPQMKMIKKKKAQPKSSQKKVEKNIQANFEKVVNDEDLLKFAISELVKNFTQAKINKRFKEGKADKMKVADKIEKEWNRLEDKKEQLVIKIGNQRISEMMEEDEMFDKDVMKYTDLYPKLMDRIKKGFNSV